MTIKTGDRVRCTLGESVIVGRVRYAGADHYEVLPDDAGQDNILNTPPWQVEVIPPEIPDDIGTLVMTAAGSVFARKQPGWLHITAHDECYTTARTLDQLWRDHGALTHIAIVKP